MLNPQSELNKKSIERNFHIKKFAYGIENRNVAVIKSTAIASEYKEVGLKEIKEIDESLYASYLHQASSFLENITLSRELLLSRDFTAHRDITLHLLHTLEKENCPSFVKKYKLGYGLLKCYLFWPYQDFFMKTAVSLFPDLSGVEFYCMLQYIVEIAEDSILRQTYNYRHLLREFWIKSPPNFKEYVIKVESSQIVFDFSLVKPLIVNNSFRLQGLLLRKILMLNNFSRYDEQNFILILESATDEDKDKILNSCSENFFFATLFCTNKLKLADLYISSLSLNEETSKVFKKRKAKYFFLRFSLQNSRLDLADLFVRWAVNREEIENFKQEIFSEEFTFLDVAFSFLISRNSVENLNKIFKWFGKTDKEIEEWKENCVFCERFANLFFCCGLDVFITRFGKFIKWLGYTKQKISTIKNKLLENSFRIVILGLFSEDELDELDEKFENKLIYLCSNKKDLVSEYIKALLSCCEDYIVNKLCIFCKNNNNISFNEEESRDVCELHPTYKVLTLQIVDQVCSSFLKKLHEKIK